MVLLGTAPPQNDLRLRIQGAGAGIDGEALRIEVERAAAFEQLPGARPADGERDLPLAHVHQGMRKSLKRRAELRFQRFLFGRWCEQQVFLRPEPESRALAIGMRTTGNLGKRHAERPSRRIANGLTSLEEVARERRAARNALDRKSVV